jgi:hypothetical protein
MKLAFNIARAGAALVVVGAALAGPAVAAGAATTPPLAGEIVSNPIITLGPGTTQPAPGLDATIPAHGDPHGSARAPVSSPVSSVPVQSGDQVASAEAPFDACVAAALLSGHSPDGCGGQAAGSSPSLVDALGSVGSCARLALAAGTSTSACGSPSTGSVALGSDATRNALGTDAVRNALGTGAVCATAAQLGLGGLCQVAVPSTGSGDRQLGGASAGGASALGAERAKDVCVGLATVTGADASRCASSGNPLGSSGQATPPAAGASHVSGQASTGPSSTQFNAACASHGHAAGGLPLTSGAAGVLGAALGAAGLAFRRVRRPSLV